MYHYEVGNLSAAQLVATISTLLGVDTNITSSLVVGITAFTSVLKILNTKLCLSMLETLHTDQLLSFESTKEIPTQPNWKLITMPP